MQTTKNNQTEEKKQARHEYPLFCVVGFLVCFGFWLICFDNFQANKKKKTNMKQAAANSHWEKNEWMKNIPLFFFFFFSLFWWFAKKKGGQDNYFDTCNLCLVDFGKQKKYFEWKKNFRFFFPKWKFSLKLKISDRQKKNLLLLRNHIKVIQIIINVEEKQKRKRKKLI